PTMWGQDKQCRVWPVAAVVLVAWLTISSALAHPDYLAYFNEFGGKDPSHKIVVGDLDWGQDLTRLSTYMRDHSIQRVSIAYDGLFLSQSLAFPKTELLQRDRARASGRAPVEV